MNGSNLDGKRIMLIDKLTIHIARLIKDEELNRILARNFFAVIAELVLQNEDPQKFFKAVTEFVNYHIKGCCSLFFLLYKRSYDLFDLRRRYY